MIKTLFEQSIDIRSHGTVPFGGKHFSEGGAFTTRLESNSSGVQEKRLGALLRERGVVLKKVTKIRVKALKNVLKGV